VVEGPGDVVVELPSSEALRLVRRVLHRTELELSLSEGRDTLQ
jgi:hypothetical protein